MLKPDRPRPSPRQVGEGSPREDPRAATRAVRSVNQEDLTHGRDVAPRNSVGVALMSAPTAETMAQLAQELAASHAREAALAAESAAYQRAVGEVLRAMAQAPGNPGLLFELLLDRAQAISGALYGFVSRYDGELVCNVATRGLTAEEAADARSFPVMGPHKPDRSTLIGCSILDRRVTQAPDATTVLRVDDEWRRKVISRAKSGIALPLLRGGDCIGAFSLAFATIGEIPERLVDLLQTFADQAVLIIENARLFDETQEALEHQTATAEVLQVISTSMTDPQPVYEKILDRCETLLKAELIGIFVEREGEVENVGFRGGQLAEQVVRTVWPMPIAESTYSTVMAERRVVNIRAVSAMTERPRTVQRTYELVGDFSFLVLPLIWENRLIGGIACNRWPPRAFSDQEVRLLGGFADQATIAIQNARMFRETQEALEQQTATAEVLRVISSSVADAQPVFEKILDSCQALFNDLHSSGVCAGEPVTRGRPYLRDNRRLLLFDGAVAMGGASRRDARGEPRAPTPVLGQGARAADHVC